MAQQSPPPVKKSVAFLQWSGVLLFLCSFGLGIYGLVAKVDLIPSLIAFIFALLGVPLSILQIDKNAFSFVLRNKDVGIQLCGTLLILFSIALSGYNYFSLRHTSSSGGGLPPASTSTPTQVPITPTVIPTATPLTPVIAQSSLIPTGVAPIDLLSGNGQGYAWDTGQNAQKTGSCDFTQNTYILSAPADSVGIGCNTENSAGSFSNFVLQVKMTILQGVDSGNAEVGPTFRVNDRGAGYQVSFGQNGYWSVTSTTKALSNSTSPYPYFKTGVGQANYLTIRVQGDTIQVQINGHDLGTYSDNESSTGFVGAQITPGSNAGKVAFSEMYLWQL
jgi:hypothetical protein